LTAAIFRAAILDSGRTFKWEGGNVIHVVGLEFYEEHNGEVRSHISLFHKTLQAFTGSMLTVGHKSLTTLCKSQSMRNRWITTICDLIRSLGGVTLTAAIL
jgi:hypothetical protein